MNIKQDNHDLDKLIRTFGKRVMPDEKTMEKARANVQAHWQSSIKNKKIKHKHLPMLQMAASFIALAAILFLLKGNLFAVQAANMGEVLFAQGTIQVSDDRLNWHNLTIKDTLRTGLWVKTPQNGFVSFALSDQSQIRLNANTVLHLDSLTQINLLKGELYHDADTQNSDSLVIKTVFGNVEHIGTRYAVAVNDSRLTVKVRSGMVKLSADAIDTTLAKGKLLELNNQGQFVEAFIAPYDNKWSWTKQAMKAININHQSLAQFVSLYAHENGLDVNWNNLKDKATRIELTGDFTQLSDEQLIKTVFLSTKFDFEINKGILTVNP